MHLCNEWTRYGPVLADPLCILMGHAPDDWGPETSKYIVRGLCEAHPVPNCDKWVFMSDAIADIQEGYEKGDAFWRFWSGRGYTYQGMCSAIKTTAAWGACLLHPALWFDALHPQGWVPAYRRGAGSEGDGPGLEPEPATPRAPRLAKCGC